VFECLNLECRFGGDVFDDVGEFGSGDEVLAQVGVGAECCYCFVDNLLDLSSECIVD